MDPTTSVCDVFNHIVTTVTSFNIVATVTFDTIVDFVIPLVVLLTSSPVMWRKERLWKFSVLQRVHLSNLVFNVFSHLRDTSILVFTDVYAICTIFHCRGSSPVLIKSPPELADMTLESRLVSYDWENHFRSFQETMRKGSFKPLCWMKKPKLLPVSCSVNMDSELPSVVNPTNFLETNLWMSCLANFCSSQRQFTVTFCWQPHIYDVNVSHNKSSDIMAFRWSRTVAFSIVMS
jgi:hypothetical protein